jgi:hypothetical protein
MFIITPILGGGIAADCIEHERKAFMITPVLGGGIAAIAAKTSKNLNFLRLYPIIQENEGQDNRPIFVAVRA